MSVCFPLNLDRSHSLAFLQYEAKLPLGFFLNERGFSFLIHYYIRAWQFKSNYKILQMKAMFCQRFMEKLIFMK